MKMLKVFLCVVVLAAVALPVAAQIPTGTLTGRVNDGTAALPGVTITVNSPNLQGVRTAVTSVNGDYVFRFLPPGEYTVTFELSGFQTVEATIRVNAAQTAQLDATMPQTRLAEEITVTSSYETISATSQVATTFEKEFIEKLPVGRTINAAALLAPGVASTGPSNYITISGAMSYENLFMVNGVVTQDNIRNTPFGLYIEDAVQETTISTAGITAEYGRFAGGVVNLLTKSGGNQFSGSLRASLTNDKWQAKTPLTTAARLDDISRVMEATLGGYILKDRLWFFLAGRDVGSETSGQTALTNVPYDIGDDEQRYEAKLTFSATASHRFVGSYMEVDREQSGYGFGTVMDLRSIYSRQLPQELLALNYTGILSDRFFVEGSYSERTFKFVGSGSPWTDLIDGTLLVQRVGGRRWWSPTFCGPCGDEERSNEAYAAKASYFLSTEKLGTHDFVAGYDFYNDIRLVDNHQSGSDFRVYADAIIDGQNIWTRLDPTADHYIMWNPIFVTSRGTAFKTDSLFINDRWRLNNKLSFNIGLRYDKNNGVNAEGNKVSDDSNLSPRVSVSYDPKGDGEWIVNASYARYVMGLANNQADSSSAAGSPATFTWVYTGPAINMGPPYLTTDQVLALMWSWFNSVGGTNNTNYRNTPSIPGGNLKILKSLQSPYTDEYVVGFTKRFGTKGMVRMDYIKREYGDFYTQVTDMNTGQVTMPNGSIVDFSVVENENDLLYRKYDAVQLSAQLRPISRLQVGGNYTWSHATGNWDGETAANGPVRSSIRQYPEYRSFAQHAPDGDLAIDQRHRGRVWAVYDLLNTRMHRLSVSGMHSFWSGVPYGSVATVDSRPYVTNPGYRTPPSSVAYTFEKWGTYTTDDIQRTDFSVNYSLVLPIFGANTEIYVQPQLINAFNRKGVESVNTSVLTRVNTTTLTAFNPWTTAPVEGVHWRKGDDFGRPTVPGSYQTPRTFRVSLGIRF